MYISSVTRCKSLRCRLFLLTALCLAVQVCGATEPATTRPATTKPAPGRLQSVQASLDQIMVVYRRVHPSRDGQPYQPAAALFRAAFVRAGGRPTCGQVREIARDLAAQAAIWDKYTKANVGVGDFRIAMMYRIYWRLTPPNLSTEDAAKSSEQRKALCQIMAALPGRLTKEFGVPAEIEGKVATLCQRAMAHYNSALASPFLRPCQTPMSKQQLGKLKNVMEKEILRLGKSLSTALKADRDRWRRDVAAGGQVPKPLPRDFGAVLLDRQLKTCSRYVIFLHGMAIRSYFMPRFADLTKRKQVFVLGLPDTYGVRYNLTNGFLFCASPPLAIGEQSRPTSAG